MGSNRGQGIMSERYTISSTGTNDDDVIQQHIALFHSSVQLVHTHTYARTHPRFKLFFYFFFNRDVFKYPGQTSLLACNKPCISVYTDDGEERRGRKGKKGNVTNRFLARIERILSIRVSVFPGATNAEEGRSRCKLRANVISKEKSFARDNSFIV